MFKSWIIVKALFNKDALYLTVIFLLLFFIGFQWTYDNSPFLNYHTGVDLDGGSYVRLVYIGSSHCGFSNNVENHENVINIKKNLRQLVEKNSYSFISVGISVDINAYQGINYLEKTGPYDEITTGSSWFNIGAEKYVWEKFQGNPSTPQIILMKSEFTVEELYGIHRSEEVVKRVSGKDEIREMLEKIRQLKDNETIEWLQI